MKQPILVIETETRKPSDSYIYLRGRLLISFFLSTVLLGAFYLIHARSWSVVLAVGPVLCPQSSVVQPVKHAKLDAQLEDLYYSKAFQLDAYEKLGGAVRVPTESYDDLLPVGQDPRWDTFSGLHSYLQDAFPLVYTNLNVTKVNTFNIVFHWQGSNASLKPLLITAHQDVVPVEPATVDDWTHPPYSGYYDGTWIWGRGSVDDKSDLIGQMIAITSLLEKGFQPSRSIVIAFGIDEESSGLEGAGSIAKYLESTYGANGFSMLVDEGGGYLRPSPEVVLSFPDVAEKGYLDVRIEVSTKGGHSSIPPKHTSIGMLSSMITEIESNPHDTRLTRDSTAFQAVQCMAAYNPNFPNPLKRLVREALKSDAALARLKKALLAMDPAVASTLGSTQAVDMIYGGVKTNALPEKVWAIVNHRIAADSSVKELQTHITRLLEPVAAKFNLSVSAFADEVDAASVVSAGRLVLTDAFGTALEPAPITPTDPDSGPWSILSSTIRATHATSRLTNASTIAVGPSLSIGNTDTKSYWNLTRHIFRYSHKSDKDSYKGIHTVDEAMSAKGLIEQIRFFTKLILNTDESTLL